MGCSRLFRPNLTHPRVSTELLKVGHPGILFKGTIATGGCKQKLQHQDAAPESLGAKTFCFRKVVKESLFTSLKTLICRSSVVLH